MDTNRPSAQPKRQLIVPSEHGSSSSRISSSIRLEPRTIASDMAYTPSAPHADDGKEHPMFPQNDGSENRNAGLWTPFPAKMLVVCPLILVNLCFIAALVVLWYLSQSRHGLFATNLQKREVLALWHLSPTVIATMDSLIFGAVGAALLRCQPYLHLLRQGGATAQDSLTLDYNGPSFVVAFKIICRRHWVAFMFSLVMLSVLYFPGRLSCH
jgi:hypothetical protein